MPTKPPLTWEAVVGAQRNLRDALSGAETGEQQARAVCTVLRQIDSTCSAACRIHDPAGHVSTVTEVGSGLGGELDHLLRQAVDSATESQGQGVQRSETLGSRVVAVPLGADAHDYGRIAVALPTSRTAEDDFWVEFCASEIGLLLRARAASAEKKDRERSQRLETIAELTSLVAHEFNNVLNSILLQVAVLEQTLPEQARSDLGVIRKLGHNAAAMVKRLQLANRQELPAPVPLDLNQEVAHALQSPKVQHGDHLHVELSPTPLPMLGNHALLQRLISLLLQYSVSAAPEGEAVTVRTSQKPNRAILEIEDTGAPIAEELLPQAFDPFMALRGPEPTSDLAIAKLLTRRLQGSINVENRAERGIHIVVEFRPAPVEQNG